MDSFIPKERLTAYERWEVAAFDEQRAASGASASVAVATLGMPPPASLESPAPGPRLPIPTPEEIEGLRADAREVGHAEGHAEGFAAGREEGLALARTEAARIAAIAEDFGAALVRAEDEIAKGLLALALDVARQVVRTNLTIRPDLVLPVVREAVSLLSSQHGHPILFLNPDDAEIVRRHLADQFSHTGWRISEDVTMGRGECRIEQSGSQIDATLETRWRHVVERIGTDETWFGNAS